MGKELVHLQNLIFQALDAKNMNLHTQIYQSFFCKCFYERYFESYQNSLYYKPNGSYCSWIQLAKQDKQLSRTFYGTMDRFLGQPIQSPLKHMQHDTDACFNDYHIYLLWLVPGFSCQFLSPLSSIPK